VKLYLLRPVTNDPLWKPWYDKSFGFVVRAPSEAIARSIAAGKAGDEGEEAWASEEHSLCVELSGKGPAELVIQDFHAA
jgi:hypothetical protein